MSGAHWIHFRTVEVFVDTEGNILDERETSIEILIDENGGLLNRAFDKKESTIMQSSLLRKTVEFTRDYVNPVNRHAIPTPNYFFLKKREALAKRDEFISKQILDLAIQQIDIRILSAGKKIIDFIFDFKEAYDIDFLKDDQELLNSRSVPYHEYFEGVRTSPHGWYCFGTNYPTEEYNDVNLKIPCWAEIKVQVH